ncbi:MAG: Methyltransferase type 11 [Ignavibacteria bacterium]|nr:Methyltransferase type 11 [Ignavibacteria bacterium]
MNKEKNTRVCPVEHAGILDNAFRRFLQNPKKILGSYIKKDMTVLDFGCGPGVFTLEIAKMLCGSGKVIAADLQDGMLEKVRQKLQGTELEQRIELHKCTEGAFGVTEKVDFVLAFYVVHEVPNQELLFEEIKSILKPNGMLYIIEPKFHVSKKSFEEMICRLEKNGFEITGRPRVFFSRTVVVRNEKQ